MMARISEHMSSVWRQIYLNSFNLNYRVKAGYYYVYNSCHSHRRSKLSSKYLTDEATSSEHKRSEDSLESLDNVVKNGITLKVI